MSQFADLEPEAGNVFKAKFDLDRERRVAIESLTHNDRRQCQRRLNVDPPPWEIAEVKVTHSPLPDQEEREGIFFLAVLFAVQSKWPAHSRKADR